MKKGPVLVERSLKSITTRCDMWPWFAQTRCQEYLGDKWGILNMDSALEEHLLTWKMEIISLKKHILLNLLKNT